MARPDVLVNTYLQQTSESRVVKALKFLIIAHAMLGIDRTSLCADIKPYVKFISRFASALLGIAMIAVGYQNILYKQKTLYKIISACLLTCTGLLMLMPYKTLDKIKKYGYKINELCSLFDSKLLNAHFQKLRKLSTILLTLVMILSARDIFFLYFYSDLITNSGTYLVVLNICIIKSSMIEGWTVALYSYSIKYFLAAINTTIQSLGKETIFCILSSEAYLSMQLRKLNLMYSKITILSKLHLQAFCFSIETLIFIFVINPTMIAFSLVLNAVDNNQQKFTIRDMMLIMGVLFNIIIIVGPACHIQSKITEEANLIKRNLLLLRCRYSWNKNERSSLGDFTKRVEEQNFSVRLRGIMEFDRALPWNIFANLVYFYVLLLQFYKLYVT